MIENVTIESLRDVVERMDEENAEKLTSVKQCAMYNASGEYAFQGPNKRRRVFDSEEVPGQWVAISKTNPSSRRDGNLPGQAVQAHGTGIVAPYRSLRAYDVRGVMDA